METYSDPAPGLSLGADKTHPMTQQLFTGKNLLKTAYQVVRACERCQKNNPQNKKTCLTRKTSWGRWQVDFTHMPKSRGNQCRLLWVDTLSNWVEASPHRTEKAQEAVNISSQKSFPASGYLGPSKATVIHHLKQVSPRGSQRLWRFNIICITLGGHSPLEKWRTER